MKRKIYFIISSIVQIAFAIYLIINANNLVKQTIESVKTMYSMFPIEFKDRVINIFQNSGSYYFIGMASICIIINIIILILAATDKIDNNKSLLILLTVFCFLTSSSSIPILLTIINFVLIMQIKEEKKEKVNEKKDIPIIEYEKTSKKNIILSIILLATYFSQFIWSKYIPSNNPILSVIIVFSFYLLMFILVILFFREKIVSDFKLLKEYFKAYFKFTAPKYALMLVSFLIVNLICILITKNATSLNQQAVESLSKISLFFLGVIWAPIVEETLFRGVIRRFIKNNIVFIIISATIFGLLHAIREESLFNIIFTTIPYATIGGFLAYTYTKTNNLSNNILMHACWNFFAFLISLAAMIIL